MHEWLFTHEMDFVFPARDVERLKQIKERNSINFSLTSAFNQIKGIHTLAWKQNEMMKTTHISRNIYTVQMALSHSIFNEHILIFSEADISGKVLVNTKHFLKR